MTIGHTGDWFDFDENGINGSNVPNQSGMPCIFALFKADKRTLVYLGSCDINMRAELLRLVHAPTPCLTKYLPLKFQFQLINKAELEQKKAKLIEEFGQSLCSS
ncbi:MAG: hypothetical protein ABSD88_00890 [Candidatus Korobacteraceae bacterium]|jgi:hypothetical protein